MIGRKRLPTEVREELRRIAQEALRNDAPILAETARLFEEMITADEATAEVPTDKPN